MAQKVSLFIPCFIDRLFPDTGVAALKILQHLGCEVTYAAQQTCCGQPAFNSGYFDKAAQLAVKALNIFHDADYVVAPSGSCVTMVKQLYGELPLPESLRKDWLQWRKRVFELSEFIVTVLGVEKWTGTFPATVTYHDACHALRELRIKEQPRQLLTSIKGLNLLEMENSEICCGFGGTFSVKF
ncbi:MAG: (Fe-S)-binding protein, partial [Calditrichia bacterium]